MTIPESRRLDFDEIPIIDIGPLEDRELRPETIATLEQACREVGFCYIVGHGFDMRLATGLRDTARGYFALTADQKSEIGLDPSMRGYLPLYYRSQISDDFAGTSHQEGFWIGRDFGDDCRHALEAANRWPASAPELRPIMSEYLEAIESLAAKLGQAFAEALGQADDFYASRFARPTSRLKLNHYPPQHSPERVDNIGVVPHTDSGAFTILWQDEHGGLEVRSKNGEWVGAPPLENSFVVNIGDILQYWSNGRFASTPHRVINRNSVDRYSIPYFVNPDATIKIAPLDGSESFAAFDYGEYQLAKWRGFFPVDGDGD